MSKRIRRPQFRPARKVVQASVNKDVKDTLEMLGFDIPKLIEHFLENVSGQKLCPLCKRQVKPVIIGRKIKE